MKALFLAIFLFSANSWADARLISVTGSAEHSIAPDMARVQVNVWAKADSAKAAQNLATFETDYFKKITSTFDLGKEELSTNGYELSPEYKWDEKNQTNKIIGYTASQSIRVILKKTSAVGKFLDSLIKDEKKLKSGIMVQGIAWDLSKREEIEKSLLADAVKNSEETAQILAKASRVKIKGIYRLSPLNFNAPMPMFDSAKMMMKSGASARETTVYSGEISVKVQVNADYEIE